VIYPHTITMHQLAFIGLYVPVFSVFDAVSANKISCNSF